VPAPIGVPRQRIRTKETAETPEPENGGPRISRPVLITLVGASVLFVIVMVVVLTRGKPAESGTPSVANAGQPGAKFAAPGAGSAANVASATQEKKDIEPTEPQARKQWLLDQYERQTRATPNAFGELLERLDTMEKTYEKDNEWVDTIQGRIKSLKQRAEKKAEEVAEETGTAAMKKAEGGDYKGALAELDKFPSDLARTAASSRVFYFRKKLSDKAMALYEEADKRAASLSDGGDLTGAAKAYDSLASFGHPQLDKLIPMRRAEIKDIAARGKNPSEGKTVDLSEQQAFFRADVYLSLPGMAVAYDAAYHEGALGARETAQQKIDLAQYPRSAVFYYAQALMLAKVGAAGDARWCAAQAARLALRNDAFRSRLLCVDARLALASFDLQAAANKASEALQLDPKNADGVFVLGTVFSVLTQYSLPQAPERAEHAKKAADYLKMAVRLDAQYARAVPPALAAEVGGADAEKYKYTGSGGSPYLPSVVLVNGRSALGEGEGTGFAVQSTPKFAYLITNFHVIKGFSEFMVTYQFEALGNLVRKTSSDVKVLASDQENDLALLQVGTEQEIKPLPLRPTTTGLALPMKLVMIGHPKGLDFTVMTGELASLNRVHQGKRHLQINSNTDCGMSGGPVIDETGHVIGVTVAKVIGLGQSIAILTEHVRDLCAKAGVTVELKTPPAK